jgi:hypothetical protein
VLFLRNQNVITQLEADEYVSPLVGVPGQSAMGQPNITARLVARRAVTVHGIVLGVLLLMLGLIHVAPLGEAQTAPLAVQAAKTGYLKVDAFPWADVSVDGKSLGTTPLGAATRLPVGPHTVKLTHPWYVPIERTVEIEAGPSERPFELLVDFEDKGTLLPGKEVPADDEEATTP